MSLARKFILILLNLFNIEKITSTDNENIKKFIDGIRERHDRVDQLPRTVGLYAGVSLMAGLSKAGAKPSSIQRGCFAALFFVSKHCVEGLIE